MNRWFVVLLVCVVGLATAPGAASAWTVELSGSGGAFIREASDTPAPVGAVLHYAYIGGSALSTAYPPTDPGSYRSRFDFEDTTGSVVPFTAQDRAGFQLAEVPGECMALIFAAPYLRAQIDETLPVSVATSISVDGTIPVAVDSIGTFDNSAIAATGFIAIICAGIFVVREAVRAE